MNILQIAAYCASFPGNFIFSLLELDKQINNGKVIYAFPEEAKDKPWCVELQKSRTVYFLPLAKARIRFSTYKKIRDICKTEEIDIIHSHFELYDIPCLFASKKVHIVWHMHDSIQAEMGIRGLLRKIQYRKMNNHVSIVTISDKDRASLINMGCNPKQVYVVKNGISVEALCGIEIDKTHPIFLSMGWDYKRKGIDLILEAAQKLRKEYHNFELIINCRKETVPYIKESISLESDDWVSLQFPQEDMKEVYSKANIFIQASRHETFSFAVCEAVYAGMRVIVSNIPGLEWSHELQSTVVFENENSFDLYCKMKMFVENFNDIVWSYPADKNLIEERYSARHWAAELLLLYEGLTRNE